MPSTPHLLPRETKERPSQILDRHRLEVRKIVADHRVIRPRVFGSALTGQDVPGSDLDILVDPLPDTTLFDLGELVLALEELLGIPVDVRTPGDLPPSFRARVVQEATAI